MKERRFYKNTFEVMKNIDLDENLKNKLQFIINQKVTVDSSNLKNDYWPTEDWISFSLKRNQDLNQIRCRAILGSVIHTNLLCYSYISQFTQLPFEFIKELIFISSPYFSFRYYNQKTIDFYNELCAKNIKNQNKLISSWAESKNNYPEDIDPLLINRIINLKLKKKHIGFHKFVFNDLLRFQNSGKEILEFYKENIFDESTVWVKDMSIIRYIEKYGCAVDAPIYKKKKEEYDLLHNNDEDDLYDREMFDFYE